MCVLKNSFLVDKGMYRLILLRRTSFLLMVDTMVVICFSHDKLWSMVTLLGFSSEQASCYVAVQVVYVDGNPICVVEWLSCADLKF